MLFAIYYCFIELLTLRFIIVVYFQIYYLYLLYYRLRIRPKCFVGVRSFDISTTVLGEKVSMPVGISPTAMQRMAHPDGELANAKGIEFIYLYSLNFKILIINVKFFA